MGRKERKNVQSCRSDQSLQQLASRPVLGQLASAAFKAAIAADSKAHDFQDSLDVTTLDYLQCITQSVLRSQPGRQILSDALGSVLVANGWDDSRVEKFCDTIWKASQKAAMQPSAKADYSKMVTARTQAIIVASEILANHHASELMREEEVEELRRKRKLEKARKQQIALRYEPFCNDRSGVRSADSRSGSSSKSSRDPSPSLEGDQVEEQLSERPQIQIDKECGTPVHSQGGNEDIHESSHSPLQEEHVENISREAAIDDCGGSSQAFTGPVLGIPSHLDEPVCDPAVVEPRVDQDSCALCPRQEEDSDSVGDQSSVDCIGGQLESMEERLKDMELELAEELQDVEAGPSSDFEKNESRSKNRKGCTWIKKQYFDGQETVWHLDEEKGGNLTNMRIVSRSRQNRALGKTLDSDTETGTIPKSLMYSDDNTDDNTDDMEDLDALMGMPFRMESIGEALDTPIGETLDTPIGETLDTRENYVAFLPPRPKSCTSHADLHLRAPLGVEADNSFHHWQTHPVGSATIFASASCPSSPSVFCRQPHDDTVFSSSWPTSGQDHAWNSLTSKTVFNPCANERDRESPMFLARQVSAPASICGVIARPRRPSGDSSSASSPWPEIGLWPRTPDDSPMCSYTLPPSEQQPLIPSAFCDTSSPCGQLFKPFGSLGPVGMVSTMKETSSTAPPLPYISSDVDLDNVASYAGEPPRREEDINVKIVYVPIVLPHRCTHCGHECVGPTRNTVQGAAEGNRLLTQTM